MTSPSDRISAVEHPAPPVQQTSRRIDQNGHRLPIDYGLLQPGNYCRLETTPSEQGTQNESTVTDPHLDERTPPRTSTIAGRIVSVDENSIVLAEAISISNKPGTIVSESRTTRVLALAPKLFKASGIRRETMAIPGEVTVERSSICDLQPVDGTNWAYIQNSGQWFERLGIDFDFNVPCTDANGAKHKKLEIDIYSPDVITDVQVYPVNPHKIEPSGLANQLNSPPKTQPYASVEYMNATSGSSAH